MQFTEPAAAKSAKLHGAGLRVGLAGGERLTPVFVARNVSEEAVTVTGRLPFTSANGRVSHVSLPGLRLAPGQMAVIDASEGVREAGLSRDTSAFGVEFEYTGAPGAVLVTALSYGRGGDLLFRLPLWDVHAQRSSTGGYPWSIDGESATAVYIKNTAAHAQRYFLQLHHPEGVYSVGVKTIEGGQTVEYDLRELRDRQVPGAGGEVIPLDAGAGQLHWSKVGAEDGVLIGRAELADLGLGVSSSYACVNCCPDNPEDPRVTPPSDEDVVGGTAAFVAEVKLRDCYGGVSAHQAVEAPVQWSSSDDSVASISLGQATAMSPGSVTITGRWQQPRSVYHAEIGEWGGLPGLGGVGSCEPGSVEMSAHAFYTVKPRVNSLSPARGLLGNTISVTINGAGLGPSPAVEAGAGVTVGGVSGNGEGTQITANLNIDVNAAGGNRAVTVVVRGQRSNSVNFFVQIPTRLVRATVAGAPGGVGPLVTPTNDVVRDLSGNVLLNGTRVCGVYRNYAFHLVDQEGQRIFQPFILDEDFHNYVGPNQPPTAKTSNIPADREVTDIQFIGYPSPQCLAFGEKETFIQGFTVKVSSRAFDLTALIHVERGNVGGNLKVDTNIISP